MRRKTAEAMDFEDRENFGFAMGEATDWVSRSVTDITDWVDDLRAGELTADEFKARVRPRFREAQDNINDWQKWWGWKAEEAGLPYVHPSLKIARIFAELPERPA